MTEFNRICFACKRKVEPKLTNNHDILFVDNKFYHLDCFVKEYRPAKRCAKCGKDVFLEETDTVKYQDKYYHGKCFEQCCQTNTTKWKTARKYIDGYIADARIEYEKLVAQKGLNEQSIKSYISAANDKIREYFAESQLLEYIRNKYNTQNPEYIIIRQVLNGKYKHIDKPIPAEHLLEMWQLKSGYLDKVYMRNQSLGKAMSSSARIRYDLAILVGKYEGYLKWKKANEIANEAAMTEAKSQTGLSSTIYIPHNKHEKVEDVSEDVKEIFG